MNSRYCRTLCFILPRVDWLVPKFDTFIRLCGGTPRTLADTSYNTLTPQVKKIKAFLKVQAQRSGGKVGCSQEVGSCEIVPSGGSQRLSPAPRWRRLGQSDRPAPAQGIGQVSKDTSVVEETRLRSGLRKRGCLEVVRMVCLLVSEFVFSQDGFRVGYLMMDDTRDTQQPGRVAYVSMRAHWVPNTQNSRLLRQDA